MAYFDARSYTYIHIICTARIEYMSRFSLVVPKRRVVPQLYNDNSYFSIRRRLPLIPDSHSFLVKPVPTMSRIYVLSTSRFGHPARSMSVYFCHPIDRQYECLSITLLKKKVVSATLLSRMSLAAYNGKTEHSRSDRRSVRKRFTFCNSVSSLLPCRKRYV